LIDIILMTLLACTALAIILLRNIFAAVMTFGIFSLLSAGLFVVMDAVDVAFTEAAVGAGISTVLMLGTLTMVPTQEKKSGRVFQPLPFAVCVLTGAALIYATLDMPAYGDPTAPVHTHVGKHYVEQSPHEMELPNMVTAVLSSYRGYDTFGETTVVFTAGVGVLLLLGVTRRNGKKDGAAADKAPGDVAATEAQR